MSAATVNATPIKVYELANGSKSLGLFRVIATWEGLMKLQSLDGKYTAICGPCNGTVIDHLIGVFTDHKTCELPVIGATPELAAMLKAPKLASAT